jgi:DNA-binding winged helix-turn-helix (wHTH) protein
MASFVRILDYYVPGDAPTVLVDFQGFCRSIASVRVRFAEFTLDSATRQILHRGGREIRLSPKAFDLLTALIEQRPRVLDKADLHRRIWPDTHVVDANLNVLVAEIRRALEDSRRHARFIRTVHAIGYAFCGEAVDLTERLAPRKTRPVRFWLVWNDRAMVLEDGDNTVGRDPQCTVWLDASGVSRRHARIRIVRGDDAVFLQDLGSKNGTIVQGSPITGEMRLTDGAVMQIGSVQLKLRVWSEGKSPETERIRPARKRV